MTQAFNAYAHEYDAWYDTESGRVIFGMEVDCIRPFLKQHNRPYLEIGVGSGRFAEALGIEYGVDPSQSLLPFAKMRGIRVVQALGEELPFPDQAFGGILIALTLCFVIDTKKVVKEAWRVLQPGGGLTLGLILRESPWGKFYAQKGKVGHPLYQWARFFSRKGVETLLRLAGFDGLDYRSVLFQPPGQAHYYPEYPVMDYRESAGFVTIGTFKRKAQPGRKLREKSNYV